MTVSAVSQNAVLWEVEENFGHSQYPRILYTIFAYVVRPFPKGRSLADRLQYHAVSEETPSGIVKIAIFALLSKLPGTTRKATEVLLQDPSIFRTVNHLGLLEHILETHPKNENAVSEVLKNSHVLTFSLRHLSNLPERFSPYYWGKRLFLELEVRNYRRAVEILRTKIIPFPYLEVLFGMKLPPFVREALLLQDLAPDEIGLIAVEMLSKRRLMAFLEHHLTPGNISAVAEVFLEHMLHYDQIMIFLKTDFVRHLSPQLVVKFLEKSSEVELVLYIFARFPQLPEENVNVVFEAYALGRYRDKIQILLDMVDSENGQKIRDETVQRICTHPSLVLVMMEVIPEKVPQGLWDKIFFDFVGRREEDRLKALISLGKGRISKGAVCAAFKRAYREKNPCLKILFWRMRDDISPELYEEIALDRIQKGCLRDSHIFLDKCVYNLSDFFVSKRLSVN